MRGHTVLRQEFRATRQFAWDLQSRHYSLQVEFKALRELHNVLVSRAQKLRVRIQELQEINARQNANIKTLKANEAIRKFQYEDLARQYKKLREQLASQELTDI